MNRTILAVAAWIQRRSENVIAALLGIMFLAFMVQIVFRYFLNLPTGWTTELSLVTWLWLVLWGTAFALKEDDEIRFDILHAAVGPRTRRVMGALVSLAAIAIYGLSLPASVGYVTFMKVERSSYLNIRLDWLYSIYVIFVVAVIARYLWILWQSLLGDSPSTATAEGSREP